MNILETYIKVMDSPLGGKLAMRQDGLGYTVDYYDKDGSFSHALIRRFSIQECIEFMEEACQLEKSL